MKAKAIKAILRILEKLSDKERADVLRAVALALDVEIGS